MAQKAAAFDPLAYGAVPVKAAAATEEFDPVKFGAVPVSGAPQPPPQIDVTKLPMGFSKIDPASRKPSPPPPDAADAPVPVRFSKGFGEMALSPLEMLQRPVDTIRGAFSGGMQSFQKAVEAPSWVDAAAHGAAAFAGPVGQMGEAINEKIQSGDYAGAAGMLTAAALPMAPSMKTIKDIATGASSRTGLFRSSETLLTRGLNPSDKNFQNHIEKGLAELKAGAPASGPINVKLGRQIVRDRLAVNNAGIKEIVGPQESIVVPGSREKLLQAQIEAIPEDIQQSKPDRYQSLVDGLHAATPGDLTIGQLNKLRSELAATQSSFYGKDLTGQLTMDAGTRAIDIARGNASRRLFYHALDNHGLGGGAQAAELNSRIGALIHIDDALRPNMNKSVAQQLPAGAKLLRKARYASPAGLADIAEGAHRSVDQDLTLAVRRWKKLPETVTPKLEPRVKGVRGTQHDLLPMGEPPLLDQPRQTSSSIGESGFRAQQSAAQAARRAPPPTLFGEQQGLEGFPGPLGQDRFGPKGEYLTPELEYLQTLQQRKLWKDTAPDLPKGQLDLQKGIPPALFGIDQTPYRWSPRVRETSTMADLHSISREIEQHLRADNPSGAMRAQAVADLEAVQREIRARQAAHKTPSAPPPGSPP